MIDKQQGYTPANTMRELIRDNAHLLPAVSRFNIPFGFGDKTVAHVCQINHVDTDTFLCVCNLLSGYPYSNFDISLSALMDYLKKAHSYFLDVTFPHIRHRLIEAINYSNTDEVALLLMKFFDNYVIEVRNHMDHENNVIFKYVEGLLNNQINEDFNITQFSTNHGHMAAKLNELKDIFIYHYKQQENARLSATLFDIINCERDMMSHFDIENKLFIPAVENLEKNIQNVIASAPEEEISEENVSSDLSILSEREKDIIRGVARGKVNKEIADELCISVHTVATHRRNISAKLNIHTSAGLVLFAIINHLIEINSVEV